MFTVTMKTDVFAPNKLRFNIKVDALFVLSLSTGISLAKNAKIARQELIMRLKEKIAKPVQYSFLYGTENSA